MAICSLLVKAKVINREGGFAEKKDTILEAFLYENHTQYTHNGNNLADMAQIAEIGTGIGHV